MSVTLTVFTTEFVALANGLFYTKITMFTILILSLLLNRTILHIHTCKTTVIVIINNVNTL